MSAHTAINPTVLLILAVLLGGIGVALAFWGRKLWTPFMSLVGAILGGTVGYIIGGFYAGGYLAAFILAIVGSILGSILFNYLVKIALALIAAAIPAALTYYALGPNPVVDQSAQDTAVIAAILVLLVFFGIAYYFVEELIGVVTALVGGFLLGIGIFLALGPPSGTLALGLGALLFLVGAAVQTLAIRAAKKGAVWRLRRRRAPPVPPPPPARAPPPAAAPPTPAPAQPSPPVPPPPTD